MSRNETPRSELYRRLRFEHQIRVTPNAMDTIEQFYHQNIKGSIKHVGLYRAINVVFAVLMLAGIIIFWNVGSTVKWFIAIMMTLFVIYNTIHLVINWIQYKRLKEPTSFDELKIPTNEPVTAYGRE